MKRNHRWLLVATLLLTALGLGAVWLMRQREAEPLYRTAPIERGGLEATVAASGTIAPVTQVQVGTQVSGQIQELLVDFNSEVKAGQLLARLDPQTFESRLRQVQADLDAARAGVLNAQAAALAAQAMVGRARVDLAEAQRVAGRTEELVAKEFASPAQLETQRAGAASAAQALQVAQAQAQVAAAQVQSAEAIVKQREAQVAQARIDIARTQIRSPVDGVVIKRSVDLGQTVAASLQAPELFVIAQNLRDMQVQAGIDEADISRVRIGQKAGFTVDAFPGRTFEGQVTQVRKAATNTQNVITYTVIVGFSNADARLLPGMTANVRLVTDTREAVLKVPNAALRMRIASADAAARAASSPAGGGAAAASAATAPGGERGRGALGAWRERLASELQLTPEQQAKVAEITAPARFASLRELPEAERAKARERIMSDVRARVAAVLTPEQLPKYAALQAEQSGRQASRGRVYVLAPDGSASAVAVRLGITDGSSTELLGNPAGLAEGTPVVVGLQVAEKPRSRGPRLSM